MLLLQRVARQLDALLSGIHTVPIHARTFIFRYMYRCLCAVNCFTQIRRIASGRRLQPGAERFFKRYILGFVVGRLHIGQIV